MTPEQIQQQIKANLIRAKAIADVAVAEGREFTADEKAEVEQLRKKAADLKAKLGDAELTRMILDLGGEQQSWAGDGRLVSGKGWGKAVVDTLQRRDNWDPTTGRKTFLTPSGSVGVPSLSATIPAVGERPESLLQVIKVTGTSAASIEYLQETVRTHAAAPVATGAVKPTSTYTVIEVNAPVETIAHLTEAIPRKYFTDAANLSRYLDTVLRMGLELAVENQVVNGTGTTPQLQGMLDISGHQHQAWDTDILTVARKGITALELLSVPQTFMVFAFHPNDWEAAELLEAGTTGAYKMNNASDGRAPINRQLRTLWGVPVVLTTALAEGVGVLFDKTAVELFERQGVTLDWSENTWDPNGVSEGVGASDFSRNMMRFRCEGRWAQAIYAPTHIVELDVAAGS